MTSKRRKLPEKRVFFHAHALREPPSLTERKPLLSSLSFNLRAGVSSASLEVKGIVVENHKPTT